MTGPHVPVPSLVLTLILRGDDHHGQLLLGVKKRGFGIGNLVAPGGHIERGEHPREAAVREAFEETGLKVECAPEPAGILDFQFPYRPSWSCTVAVYRATPVGGTLTGSDELDAEWFDARSLPLDRMWDDNRYWLPQVLAGDRVNGRFFFGPDNATVDTFLPLVDPRPI